MLCHIHNKHPAVSEDGWQPKIALLLAGGGGVWWLVQGDQHIPQPVWVVEGEGFKEYTKPSRPAVTNFMEKHFEKMSNE